MVSKGEIPEVFGDKDEVIGLARTGAPKPILPLLMRSRIILCRPLKAPAQMKRILSVFTL